MFKCRNDTDVSTESESSRNFKNMCELQTFLNKNNNY